MAELKLSFLIKAIDQGAAALIRKVTGENKALTGVTKALTATAKPAATAQQQLKAALAGTGKMSAAAVRELGGYAAVEKLVAEAARHDAGAQRVEAQAIAETGRAARTAGQAMDQLGRKSEHAAGHSHNAFTHSWRHAKHHLLRTLTGYTLFSEGIRAAEAVIAAPVTVPIKLFKFGVGGAQGLAELKDHADAVDLNTTQYQRLRGAYALNALDVDKLDEHLSRLRDSQLASVRGGKEQAKAFKVLGINVWASRNKLKGMAPLYDQIADSYARLHVKQQKSFVAEHLFGMTVEQTNAVLSKGSAGLREWGDEAERSGNVLTPEQLAMAKAFTEQWGKFKFQLQGFRNEALVGAIPVMREIVTGWSTWLSLNREQVKSNIVGFFRRLREDAPKIVAAFDTIGDKLAGIDWDKTARGITVVAQAVGVLADAAERLPAAWSMLAGQGLGPAKAPPWLKDVAQARDAMKAGDFAGAASATKRAQEHGMTPADLARLSFPDDQPARPAPLSASGRAGWKPALAESAQTAPPSGKLDVTIKIDQDGRAKLAGVRSSSDDISTAVHSGLMAPGH